MADDTATQSPEQSFAAVIGRDPSKPKKQAKVQELDSPEAGLEKLLGRKLSPAPKKSWLLSKEERIGSKMEAAPESEQESPQVRIGKMIPEAAVKPLDWVQKNVNEPLNKAGRGLVQAGREAGRDVFGEGADPKVRAKYGMEKAPVLETAIGIAGGVGGAVGGALDPRYLPLFALGGSEISPILQRLMSGAFATQLGEGSYETVKNLHDNWDKLTPEQRAEMATEGGISAAMATAAGLHVASGIETPPEVLGEESQASSGKRSGAGKASTDPSVPPPLKTAPKSLGEVNKQITDIQKRLSGKLPKKERTLLVDKLSDLEERRVTPPPEPYGPPKADFHGEVPSESLGFNPNPPEDFGNKVREQVERRMGGPLQRGQAERRVSSLSPTPPPVPEVSQPEANTQAATDWHNESLRLAKEKLPNGSLSEQLQEAAKIQKAGKPTETVKTEPAGAAVPGQVAELPVSQIIADPRRFQFRYTRSESGLGSLMDVGDAEKYDPKLAGIVAVWQDPADGQTYIVNGHHRLELAKRTGEPTILTRSLDATDAQEARAQGALINIAEGHASEIDAAKFFRDTEMTASDLRDQGIAVSAKTARGGLALSKLSAPIFDRVIHGDISKERGIVIGEELSDPAEQSALLKLVEKKPKMSPDEVRELARFVKDAGTTDIPVETLFGEENISQSNAIEKAELSSWIKKQLASDKKLFGFVSKADRARELSRAGNIIDVEQSAEVAQSSKVAEEGYNRLIRRMGPVSDAIDEGARRLVKGEDVHVVRKDIYRRIREAVSEVLPGTEAASRGSVEAGPTTGGESGIGERSALEEPPEWKLEMLLGRPIDPVEPPAVPSDLNEGMEPTPSLFDTGEPAKPVLSIEQPESEFEFGIPGPGAQNVGTVRETPSDIIQLRDSLAAVTSDHQGLRERLNVAGRLASNLSKGTDALTASWNKVKTNFAALWNAYTTTQPWTDFKSMLGDWQYADQRAEHEAYAFAQEIVKAVPDKMKRQAIVNYIEAEGDRDTLLARAFASSDKWREGYLDATTLTEPERVLADNIRNYFEARLQAAIDGGLLDHGVENYVHRILKNPDKSPIAKKLLGEVAMGKLQTNPRFAKKRLFETSFDAEQAGMEHVNKDAGFLVTAYDLSFNRALSARAFIKSLLSGNASDGRPLVSVTGSGTRINDAERGPEAYIIRPKSHAGDTGDYKSIDHPALRKWKWAAQDAQGAPMYVQGDLAVHPEAYQHLKNVLSTSALQANPITRTILKGQGTLKSTMLSASLFHQEQIGTHAIGHWVNPADVPEINWDDTRQQGLIKGGLQVVNHHALDEFSEGVGGTGLTKYVPVVGPKLADYQQYLFGDYIPRLKMKMAMAALERNRERYSELSEGQLNEMTANQANAAFGELNYKMLGRNPTFQDVMRVVLLAPDFLEARGRFVGQALKPGGREQAVALIRIGGILWGGARVMNMLFNDGDPKWDKPFSVVVGGHEFSVRSIPGDIYHLATNPRSFFLWRLNPFTTRPAIEMLYGRNAYGQKQTAYDEGVNYLKSVLPITMQKWPENVYNLGHDLWKGRDTGPDLNHVEKDFLDGLLNSVGVREATYRSPAADLAFHKMLDGLPSDVSKKALEHGRKLHDYEQEFKSGGLGIDRINELVKSGDLTQADAKTILSPKGQYDDLQRSLTHLSAKDAMEVWKISDKKEQAEIINQMITKINRSRSMTAEEKHAAIDEILAVPPNLGDAPKLVPSLAPLPPPPAP